MGKPGSRGYGRALAVVAALVVAASIFTAVYLYYGWIGVAWKPLVAVLRLKGPLIYPEDADFYLGLLEEAVENKSVKALVLLVDSPGGYADLVESLYLELLTFKKDKPLVAVAQLALSGGYYISVASDYIYVYPTGFVGNVGVIGVGPPTLVPSEQILETGPYKATGFSKLLFPYNLTHALDNFVSAVEEGRRGRLRLSRAQVARGLIYMGSEAVQVGLADGVGSLRDGIKLAAEKAGLIEYEVVDLNTGRRIVEALNYTASSSGWIDARRWGNLTLEELNEAHPPPALYYLYLPPELSTKLNVQARGMKQAQLNVTEVPGEILVDLTHGNTVSWWDLDALFGELIKRNVTVGFAESWEDLEGMLYNASVLIVATPTQPYSREEAEEILEYVESGGTVVFFFDPSSEYVEIPDLTQPINSLASRLGVYFAGGYLYDEKENFGIYRNIYVENFTGSHPLVGNLSRIVLFTATHIYTSGLSLAYTSNETYSSTAEKPRYYTVIAWVEKGNGSVIALGDLSFIQEPYCHVEDNYKLVENLASILAEAKPPLRKPGEKPSPEEVPTEVEEPKIEPGVKKIYRVTEDGETYRVTWFKVSDREVVVEYPEITFHYYYDEEGRMTGWTADGLNCTYLDPIPKPPYPLTEGEEWSWRSNYTLIMYGEEASGRMEGYYKVEALEYVEAAGARYFCAKIKFRLVDVTLTSQANFTSVTEGYQWISGEVGLTKEEEAVAYYIDNTLRAEVERTMILEEIVRSKESTLNLLPSIVS